MQEQVIGRVTQINDSFIKIKVETNILLNQDVFLKLVIFQTASYKIVGKIDQINADEISVSLIGELKDSIFNPGVVQNPVLDQICYMVNKEELVNILMGNNRGIPIPFGKLPQFNNIDLNVDSNIFFSNHFAIFGSSGSGKSSAIARILQNTFFSNIKPPRNATVVIFDAYGEYDTAFDIQNETVKFKKYLTNTNENNQDLIKIPLWLLSVDDIALLLNATDANQLPIIEKALRLVTVFAKEDQETRVHKNNIIAGAIMTALQSGGNAAQIRDQIFSILVSFNTTELNLDSQVVQPGYTRTLRQCMIVDKDGKIQEIQLISEFMSSFIRPDLKLGLHDGKTFYTLENLKEALDFALISEGILKSDRVYNQANILKVRLDLLINSECSKYFHITEYISKKDYIKSLITTKEGNRAQIINVNLNYLDDRFAKTICKIYSKILFEFTTLINPRSAFPIHLIIEEAHRYIQNDNDIELLGYNIFDRITKEGRKYGMILGMISQRPSELSQTTISQCSNFLIFKMLHPYDIDYIMKTLPNMDIKMSEILKILQPGTSLAFGSAFKFPLLIKYDLPNPMPKNENVNISNVWY